MDNFTLSIRLRHDAEDLCTVAAQLGLFSDRHWRAGEEVRALNGALTGSTRQESYLSSRVVTGENMTLLNACLKECVSKLTVHEDAIRSFIGRGGRIELLVGWFFERTSGLLLTSDVMTGAGSLGVELSFMAYGESAPTDTVKRFERSRTVTTTSEFMSLPTHPAA